MGTEDQGIFSFPSEFLGISVDALSAYTRGQLARLLDKDGHLLVIRDGPCMGQDIVTNYNGLGELINLDYDTLREISVITCC